jgi:Uma2 family endonuclease
MDSVTSLSSGQLDGWHRFEAIEGSVLVTPAPNVQHQRVSMKLAVLLFTARTEQIDVLVAPLDVVLGDETLVQPDLVVARRGAFTETDLPMAPLLAVEIVSTGTELVDLNLKKSLYGEAGTESYSVVDPSVPRLVAWELDGGTYVKVADVEGDEAWTAQAPYPVTIVPSALID